ncbi:MAG: hypothetical protein ACLR23_00150 [Clostridia bacterium]
MVEDDIVTFWRNRVGERQFNAEYTGGFGNQNAGSVKFNPGRKFTARRDFKNFTAAVQKNLHLCWLRL